ncbi:MAG: hypothetical protein HYT98_04960 [Candidatus Sungbacteria bacterium]|nr:hypothetical protein [Candidatus Sungbacteria bacterium]
MQSVPRSARQCRPQMDDAADRRGAKTAYPGINPVTFQRDIKPRRNYLKFTAVSPRQNRMVLKM